MITFKGSVRAAIAGRQHKKMEDGNRDNMLNVEMINDEDMLNGMEGITNEEMLSKYQCHEKARGFLLNRCEACEGSNRLEAHHIDQDRENNIKENIQTLCYLCHHFWHIIGKTQNRKPVGRMPKLFTNETDT